MSIPIEKEEEDESTHDNDGIGALGKKFDLHSKEIA